MRRTTSTQVERTIAFLEAHTRAWQVVIVNDGSADRTVADEYARERPGNIVAVHHAQNRGMGAAIRNGYAAATCEWAAQLPAVVRSTLKSLRAYPT